MVIAPCTPAVRSISASFCGASELPPPSPPGRLSNNAVFAAWNNARLGGPCNASVFCSSVAAALMRCGFQTGTAEYDSVICMLAMSAPNAATASDGRRGGVGCRPTLNASGRK